jgi:hypothetical protein
MDVRVEKRSALAAFRAACFEGAEKQGAIWLGKGIARDSELGTSACASDSEHRIPLLAMAIEDDVGKALSECPRAKALKATRRVAHEVVKIIRHMR